MLEIETMVENVKNKNSEKDIIASVEKAASLLLLYKDSFTEELSIKEISEKLIMPKATVSRIAATLVRSNFLEQNDENKKYKLGINVYILGNRYQTVHVLEKIGHSYLEKIVKKFGESASISIFNKTESVIVDKVDGVYSIRVVSQIGIQNPLHCSGSGKVFLAYLKSEECRKVIKQISPLKAYTPYTITDSDQLLENISHVQERGYAYDDEEIHSGQTCISAPVYDHLNKVCAAITVSGPKERIHEKGIDNIGNQLKVYCNLLSKEMGCTLYTK
jgi:IclR family transcriptional regulator, KDG regulon repressor